MKKVLSAFLVSSVLFLCAAPFFSSAATNPAPVADSELQAPVVDYYSDGTYDYYKLYFVTYHPSYSYSNQYTPKYVLLEENLKLVANSFLQIEVNNDTTYFESDNAFTRLSLNYYDALNGTILRQVATENSNYSNNNHIYYLPIGNGNTRLPRNGEVSQDFYCIAPSNVRYELKGTNYYSTSGFINWYEPKGNVIRSNIPQPLSDFTHYYFADDERLYQVHLNYPFYLQSVGLYGSSLTANEFFEQVYVNLSKRDANTVTLEIHNRSEHSFSGYLNQYDIVNGEYITGFSFNVSAADQTDGIYTYNQPVHNALVNGIWYIGFVNTDGLLDFDRLQISWSDTIDYTSDFIAIKMLIQDSITQLTIGNQTLESISQLIDAIYTIVDSGFTWLKTTYYNTINSKWDISNSYLLSIYNLLNESEETVTINDETSVMNEMESAKNDLIITDASGQAVDAGEAAAVGLSEAASQIGDIAQPVSTINQLMQTIVFDKPKLLLPVIVALGLGLMVTILGKNKSD